MTMKEYTGKQATDYLKIYETQRPISSVFMTGSIYSEPSSFIENFLPLSNNRLKIYRRISEKIREKSFGKGASVKGMLGFDNIEYLNDGIMFAINSVKSISFQHKEKVSVKELVNSLQENVSFTKSLAIDVLSQYLGLCQI